MVTVSDGTPASNAIVTVLKPGIIKGTSRQATTSKDGTFVFSVLPCGKYQIIVGSSVTSIEIKAQATIELKVDQKFTDAARIMSELSEAREAHTQRELTPDEARDEEIAAHFRDQTARRLASSDEYRSYESKTTPDEKKMQFAMILSKYAMKLDASAIEAQPNNHNRSQGSIGPLPLPRNPFKRDPTADVRSDDGLSAAYKQQADQIAKDRINIARQVISKYLTSEQARTFDEDSRRNRVRKTLMACRELLAQTTWPSPYLLFMTDLNWGVGAKELVRTSLGADSAELQEWDMHLSPRWRGETVRRAMLVSLDKAIAVENGEPGLEDFVGAIASPSESNSRRAMQTVVSAFGTTMLERYKNEDRTEQRTIVIDAALMNLATSLAYFLSL
jgi:hypothetical protein